MQIQAGAPLIPSPPANEGSTQNAIPQRLLYLGVVIVAVPVYLADQLAKAWVTANLLPDQPRDVIGSVLRLNLIRNSGAAFSIGTGATWLLTAIACSVVVFVVFMARRLGSRGWALALGLLLGGSLGNLTDRMFRAPGPGRGHVVDFIQLPHFAIFNLADSAIVTAAVLIAVLAFRGVGIDGTRASSHRPEAGIEPEGGTEPEGDIPADESLRDQLTPETPETQMTPETTQTPVTPVQPDRHPTGTDGDV